MFRYEIITIDGAFTIEELYQAFKARLLEEHKELIETQLNDMYGENNE